MDVLRFLFGAVSDPSKYYPALGHETISSKIITSLHDGESLQVVLGNFGSGKTTLAMRWLAEIGKKFNTVFLPSKRYANSALLLRDINDELGLPPAENIWNIRRQIEDSLLSSYENNKYTLFMVDGAHNLPESSLKDLISFTNLTGTKGPALSLILLGHEILLDKITGNQDSIPIKNPFVVEKIPSLEIEELVDFARHQIRLAGLDPDHVIDSESLHYAGALSKGNIGLMIIILRLSWRFARINEMNCIEIELIESAYNSVCFINCNLENKFNENKSECMPQAISS